MPVTINPASQISAAQWVGMFRRSQDVPDYLRRNIRANGNTITGPTRITQPADTIPKDWPDDLAAAFAAQNWEITTAAETFVVEKDATGFHVRRRIAIDLQQGEFGAGIWLTVGQQQRQWMPDIQTLDTAFQVGAIGLEYGETFSSPTRLRSQRHLIIVVNRVTVYGVKPGALMSSWFPAFSRYFETSRQFTMPESRLLSTFLHELAVHAGRMEQGKNADHGNSVVETSVEDILKLFPADQTLESIAAAVHEAESRLKDLESSVKAGRSPAPSSGAATAARRPGPVGL
jgi:hypothetical protein